MARQRRFLGRHPSLQPETHDDGTRCLRVGRLQGEDTVVQNLSIRPGQVWLDTSGSHIQAHGGSIIYVDDTFYWYGENKEKSTEGSGIWHWGVRCYASKDLYNWEDKGLIIPPDVNDPSSPLHPSKFVDRP